MAKERRYKRPIKEFEGVPNPWKGDQNPVKVEYDPKTGTKGKATIKREEKPVEPKPVEEGVPETVMQAEGEAHNEDTAKADKKIVLPEKTYEALKKKAEVEHKTPDQKAAEIVEQKAKAKKTETKPTSPFPTDARINDYGFLGFKTGWLTDLGWTKGMALKIDKNPDGSITLRKA
jgi:hypothetical protein